MERFSLLCRGVTANNSMNTISSLIRVSHVFFTASYICKQIFSRVTQRIFPTFLLVSPFFFQAFSLIWTYKDKDVYFTLYIWNSIYRGC